MNYEGTQESAEMSYSDVFEIVHGLAEHAIGPNSTVAAVDALGDLVCNMHEEIDEAFPLTGQPVSSGGRKWTSTSCTTVRPETSWMPETRSRQIDHQIGRASCRERVCQYE